MAPVIILPGRLAAPVARQSHPPTGSVPPFHKLRSRPPASAAALPAIVGGRFIGRCRPEACRSWRRSLSTPGASRRQSRGKAALPQVRYHPSTNSEAALPQVQWLYRLLWEADLSGDAGRGPADHGAGHHLTPGASRRQSRGKAALPPVRYRGLPGPSQTQSSTHRPRLRKGCPGSPGARPEPGSSAPAGPADGSE